MVLRWRLPRRALSGQGVPTPGLKSEGPAGRPLSACQQGIDKLTDAVIPLEGMVPHLRYQQSLWMFATACSPKYHTRILSEALAVPLGACGYRLPSASPMDKVADHMGKMEGAACRNAASDRSTALVVVLVCQYVAWHQGIPQ